jgi:uncharacterized coiled-coil protein SlyX
VGRRNPFKMELAAMYVQEFQKNIVDPLKEQLAENKKEVTSLKRYIKKLTDAVKEINNCPHRADCPVLDRLPDNQPDGDA